MPNLYGPNDNFDLESFHVLPALIRKFHLAKLAARGDWGSPPKRRIPLRPPPRGPKSVLLPILKKTCSEIS